MLLGSPPHPVAAQHGWHWAPDEGIAGWVTVVAYLAVAALAAAAWRRGRHEATDATVRRVWASIAAVMLAFAAAKQFGLQTLLVDRGRDLAFSDGWYEDRRPVQALVVLVLAVVGTLGVGLVVRWVRPVRHEVGGAVAGVAVLTVFVAVRAVSLHQIDRVLGRGPIEVGTVVELAAIAVIGASAARWLRAPRNPDRSGGRAAEPVVS